MSVQLVCDFCGKAPEDRRSGWMVEIRGVTATNTSEIHRSDYPMGQVHWDCLAPFVDRTNAKEDEVPF